MTRKQTFMTVCRLSIPTMLAQLTSIIMQYIDAAMVGNLGASASAAIGVVSSSTWLLGGLCTAVYTGFSVQIAHAIGAGDGKRARQVLKTGLLTSLMFSLILMMIGIFASPQIPEILGASKELWRNSSGYFFVYACSIPLIQLNGMAGAALQCSGNMKTPSILNASMCLLDVCFNFVLIRRYGVIGAALGTAFSQLVISCLMLWCACKRERVLAFRKEEGWKLDFSIARRAFQIGIPMAVEHLALCSAMVASTRIIAPLGTVAIAANSFAITVESFCYMPGFGIGTAATTLVGQSLGAEREKEAVSYARMTVLFGSVVMGITGIIAYVVCPFMFQMLTPDLGVRRLGVKVLRLELFAEPMYGASIVATGAMRGAGDTLVPSILNLLSIWGVRITLSLLLVGKYGLYGTWIAMFMELCFRGVIFLIRLLRGRWVRSFYRNLRRN